jgi:predicted nicotinamide N-methyase
VRNESFIRRVTTIETPPLLPELRLRCAQEITPLWEATEKHVGGPVPPPYWAFAWAGGIALARVVFDRPELVRGRRVVDFASGCGLVGIAARLVGARSVLCADIDPLAADAARINAELNGTEVEVTEDDIVGTRRVDDADAVLAADICYEKATSERVATWLGELARAGREVVLADPGRAYAPSSGLEEIARFEVPTTKELESRPRREAVVYRVSSELNSGTR